MKAQQITIDELLDPEKADVVKIKTLQNEVVFWRNATKKLRLSNKKLSEEITKLKKQL